jgi:hypothetical protein
LGQTLAKIANFWPNNFTPKSVVITTLAPAKREDAPLTNRKSPKKADGKKIEA